MTPEPPSSSTPPPGSRSDGPAGIVLLGLRGSGKSTVGQMLAEKLRRPFTDLDDLVLASFPEQTSVAAVWETRGEEEWRVREAALGLPQLAECAESASVLALGGGTGMIPSIRALLADRTNRHRLQVIYLCGSPKLLSDRLRHSPGDRPALTDATELVDEFRAIHAARDPIYRELADIVIELVKGETPRRLVTRITRILRDRIS